MRQDQPAFTLKNLKEATMLWIVMACSSGEGGETGSETGGPSTPDWVQDQAP